MRKYLFTFVHITAIIFSAGTDVRSQSGDILRLEDCYTMARANYPLIRQQQLIDQSARYAVSNVAKGYYPQFAINGQASYQSAVTEVPVKFPGFSIESPDKDQYKIYGEVNQVVYDGGAIRQQKKIQQANASIENQKLEVELYKLRDRINQLFFGILMLDEQLAQVTILKKDLKAGLDKTTAAFENGIALKSSVDIINAELLKSRQREIELESARTAYLQMLGIFINRTLDQQTVIEKPRSIAVTTEIRRPELSLFDTQQTALNVQDHLLKSKNRPRFNLFFQGGYGRPALNMLSNEFDTYYIGGLRLQWNLSGLYTFRKDKRIVDLNRQTNQLQKETFLFNTNIAVLHQGEEISKFMKLLATDDEIISLRNNIKNTAASQLENGVITSSDFIREVNAADMAKQNKILHEVQLLMAQYNQQTLTGN